MTPALRPPPKTRHAPRPALGFTLVEVLVAVSILGVVGSMGVVRYQSSLDVARIAKAMAELRVISTAIDMYYLENGFQHPETLYDVDFGDRRDPWGSPYMYLNFVTGTGTGAQFTLANGLIDPSVAESWGGQSGQSAQDGPPPPSAEPPDPDLIESLKRKDRFLFPLNSDYDLFSVGRNGKAWASVASDLSLDDVIRANDGDFFGIAAAY